MDFMAVVSRGVYPTPGVSGAQRAALAADYGLFAGPLSSDAPVITTIAGIYPKFYGGYWCCTESPEKGIDVDTGRYCY